MKKLLSTIDKYMSVGIYDNCRAIARIYDDRTVVTMPAVRWVGNTGGYHESKHRIVGRQHEAIKAAMLDSCEDTAWELISESAQ